MLLMVVLGVGLRFIQESEGADAAKPPKLKAMINVTATVLREGKTLEVPLGQLVPGDLVKLSAGDMIPADVRIISSKRPFPGPRPRSRANRCRWRSSTRRTRDPTFRRWNFPAFASSAPASRSGTATAAIVETGHAVTYLGCMATEHVRTTGANEFLTRAFTDSRGSMIRFMMVMVPLVFLYQRLCSSDDWKQALFLLPVGRRRPHSRNASHDHFGLPLQRRDGHGPQKSHR